MGYTREVFRKETCISVRYKLKVGNLVVELGFEARATDLAKSNYSLFSVHHISAYSSANSFPNMSKLVTHLFPSLPLLCFARTISPFNFKRLHEQKNPIYSDQLAPKLFWIAKNLD